MGSKSSDNALGNEPKNTSKTAKNDIKTQVNDTKTDENDQKTHITPLNLINNTPMQINELIGNKKAFNDL